MKATRIKWDPSMTVRCFARMGDYYGAHIKAEKQAPIIAGTQAPAMAAEPEFTLDFDIPDAVEGSATQAKPVQKTKKWDDFHKAMDKALNKQLTKSRQ